MEDINLFDSPSCARTSSDTSGDLWSYVMGKCLQKRQEVSFSSPSTFSFKLDISSHSTLYHHAASPSILFQPRFQSSLSSPESSDSSLFSSHVLNPSLQPSVANPSRLVPYESDSFISPPSPLPSFNSPQASRAASPSSPFEESLSPPPPSIASSPRGCQDTSSPPPCQDTSSTPSSISAPDLPFESLPSPMHENVSASLWHSQFEDHQIENDQDENVPPLPPSPPPSSSPPATVESIKKTRKRCSVSESTDQDLRRSKRYLVRNKIGRLELWRGETPIYELNDNGFFEIKGLTKASTPDILKRKKRVYTRKEKDDRKRASQIINKELSIRVLPDNLEWKDKGDPENGKWQMATEKQIRGQDSTLAFGFIKIYPNSRKPLQRTINYDMFLSLEKGKAKIKIGDKKAVMMEPLKTITVPDCTYYQITNLSSQEVIIKFIVYKYHP